MKATKAIKARAFRAVGLTLLVPVLNGCLSGGGSSTESSGQSGATSVSAESVDVAVATSTSAASSSQAVSSPSTPTSSQTGTQPVATVLPAVEVTPMVGPYQIIGKSNVVIDGLNLTNPNGHCIEIVSSSNVTIKNVVLKNCYGVGVRIYRSNAVVVEASYVENTNAAVYVEESTAIKVRSNRFKNVDKKKANASRGQFVQFNSVTGPGNEILNNRGVNEPDRSDPEDLISIYASEGTESDPIKVTGNCFRGGGPSLTGGGILVGDHGARNVVIDANVLVDVGQHGIGVAGGYNLQVTRNKIYGRRQAFSNVGIYVWSQVGSQVCGAIKATTNQIDFTDSKGLKNPLWNGGNCGVIEGWDQNDVRTDLSSISCSVD